MFKTFFWRDLNFFNLSQYLFFRCLSNFDINYQGILVHGKFFIKSKLGCFFCKLKFYIYSLGEVDVKKKKTILLNSKVNVPPKPMHAYISFVSQNIFRTSHFFFKVLQCEPSS